MRTLPKPLMTLLLVLEDLTREVVTHKYQPTENQLSRTSDTAHEAASNQTKTLTLLAHT